MYLLIFFTGFQGTFIEIRFCAFQDSDWHYRDDEDQDNKNTIVSRISVALAA